MRVMIIVFLMLGLAAPVAAQTPVGRFGDWTLQCSAVGVGKTSCALNQQVVTGAGAFLADVTLSRTAVEGQARTLMVLLTPQGVALRITPAYQVDGAGPQVALSWRSCSEGTCRAATILEPAQEAALKAGGRMVVGYRLLGQNRPVGAPISLSGVTAGLNALGGS